MYIKITRNQAGQAYYHLVESYRENGKTRQRTLLSLGRVGEEGRLKNLAEALARHEQVVTALDLANEVSVSDTFILGPLVLLEKMFDTTGISAVMDRLIEKHSRFGFDLKKILFTIIACRFIRPSSKLKIFEKWQHRLYPEMVEGDLALHQIYRSLDFLAQHKDEIEKSLFWHDKDLFNTEVDVVLYDLTTLRFESTKETENLRRFGYSKEMRTDCTQIVFGLLLNLDGIPLGFEVYPGNTFEGKTLKDITNKMREKFKIRRFIFVADRGLFSSENIAELKKEDGEFIVGMRLGAFRNRKDEFYDLSRFSWIGVELAVYETTHEGDRCIVTWSKVRADRDRKTRDDILAKIRKKLSLKKVTSKTFVSNRNYQKYLTNLADGERPALNEKTIAEDSKKDGFFGIVTNVKDLSAADIVVNYKELWKIEDAFGELKGNLKTRPVFHWTDKRIIGHLTMCFLAFLCEAHMTKLLREKRSAFKSDAITNKTIKPRPLTVVEAMDELREVRAIPVTIRGKTLWVRTDINGNAATLFQALGVRIPPRVLNLEQQNVVAQN